MEGWKNGWLDDWETGFQSSCLPALSLIFSLILALLMAACIGGTPGTLAGHVNIGPLVPVQRAGEPEPTPAPEVYAARQIVVYTENGRTEVARAQINSEGDYEVKLPPGIYLVDINRIGIDSAKGLPQQVEIRSGQVTRLDVEIDTGIR